jgi:hypothetical protein
MCSFIPMSTVECTVHCSLQVPTALVFTTSTVPSCSGSLLFGKFILLLQCCMSTLVELVEFEIEKIQFSFSCPCFIGRNGGAMVIAKSRARCVHSIVPNQREWLSVLLCINASGKAIPTFYIFRGKRFWHNYIEHCEAGATMAMQPRAWMTSYLFNA